MAGGYCPSEYFPTLYSPSAYFPRFNSTPPPPPVVSQDGGGGDRRRDDEMSVEQWRLMKRQIAEDDELIMQVAMKFLGTIQ